VRFGLGALLHGRSLLGCLAQEICSVTFVFLSQVTGDGSDSVKVCPLWRFKSQLEQLHKVITTPMHLNKQLSSAPIIKLPIFVSILVGGQNRILGPYLMHLLDTR